MISFIVIFKSFEIQTKKNYKTSTKGLTLHKYVNTHACLFSEKKYAVTLTTFHLYKIYMKINSLEHCNGIIFIRRKYARKTCVELSKCHFRYHIFFLHYSS